MLALPLPLRLSINYISGTASVRSVYLFCVPNGQAKNQFDWINTSFVLLGQIKEPVVVCHEFKYDSFGKY